MDGRRLDREDDGRGGTGGTSARSYDRYAGGGRDAASESARGRSGTGSRRAGVVGDVGEHRPSSSSTAGYDRSKRVELVQDDALRPPSDAMLPDRERPDTLVAAVLMLSRPSLARPALDAE